MRDYNFFSPYIESKRSYKDDRNILFISIVAVLIASALLYYGWNQYRLLRMEREIAGIDSYLSAEQTMQGVRQYQETKQKIKTLQEYQVIIEDVNRRIDSSNIINTRLLDKLSDTLPQAVELNIASITSDGLQLQGKSASRTAVAEYVHNLKETEAFASVYVSNISEEGQAGTDFIFTLACKMGVNSKDEAE